MIEIEAKEYKTLCQDQQNLMNVRDLLESLTKDGESCVNVGFISWLAGIGEEVTELRKEREATDGKS